MEPGSSPKKVTSKRKIKYRRSSWNVHQFEVWSGELVCRAVAVKMEESLLLWVGGAGAAGEAALGAVALGLPAQRLAARALATTLLAGGGEAEALALRVAAGLLCPVLVCSALPLDRFSAPLVELGLATEIKNFPHYFYSSSNPKKNADGVCSKNEGEGNKTCVKPEPVDTKGEHE